MDPHPPQRLVHDDALPPCVATTTTATTTTTMEEPPSPPPKRGRHEEEEDHPQQPNDDDDDDDGANATTAPVTKRRRAVGMKDGADDEELSLPRPTAQFLPFHLSMLQALYRDGSAHKGKEDAQHQQPQDNQEEEEGSGRISSRPDAAVWAAVEDFVRQRPQIWQAQYRAQQAHGVHYGAEQYVLRSRRTKGDGDDPSVTNSPCGIMSRSSPHSRHGSPAHSRQAADGDQERLSPHRHPRHAFGLLAVLLRQRATALQAEYRRLAQPFEALRQFVQTHLAALEAQREALARQRQTVVAARWQQTLRRDESAAATGTTASATTGHTASPTALAAAAACGTQKHGLWKLLAQDLEEALTQKLK